MSRHVKDADLNKAMNEARWGCQVAGVGEKDRAARRLWAGQRGDDCRVGVVSDTEKNVHC